MPRHPTHPALSAFVHLNGVPQSLQELDLPPPQPGAQNPYFEKTVTKYIESTSNNLFHIQVSVRPSKVRGKLAGELLGFFVEIDGQKVSYGAVCGPRGFGPVNGKWNYVFNIEFEKTLEGTVASRHFKFAELQEVHHAPQKIINEDQARVEKLGEITVKVFILSYGAPLAGIPAAGLQSSSNKMASQVLNGTGLSHATQLCPSAKLKDSEKPALRQAFMKKGHQAPIAIFRFRYRSKEELTRLTADPYREPHPDRPELRNQFRGKIVGGKQTNKVGPAQNPHLNNALTDLINEYNGKTTLSGVVSAGENKPLSEKTNVINQQAPVKNENVEIKVEIDGKRKREENDEGELEIILERPCKRKFTIEEITDLVDLTD